MLLERLKSLDHQFEEHEKRLKANYLYFKILAADFKKFSIDSTLPPESRYIDASNIGSVIFGTFMKEPSQWRDVSDRR